MLFLHLPSAAFGLRLCRFTIRYYVFLLSSETYKKTRQTRQASVSRSKTSRWRSSLAMTSPIGDDVVSPHDVCFHRPRYQFHSLSKTAQIMDPYCKEGGLGAHFAARFRVITHLRSLPFLSCISSAQHPSSWFISTFSGYRS